MPIKHTLYGLLVFVTGCTTDLTHEVKEIYSSLPDDIDYNFDIKPILSDRCYACHGPDELARKGDLRLDVEAAAKTALPNGHLAIAEGSLKKSALIERIMSADPETTMPPPESKLTLSAREKALLAKWINTGAEYKSHWSFIKPDKPDVPEGVEGWTQHNEIDHFVQKHLQSTGLEPAGLATPNRILRRVFMDITGLPPTLSEQERYLSSPTLASLEVIVDSLLASDACAERLTQEWMDVARYADSHGLHADGWRNMWPWRDWVINAFRDNMPYDQFITWQLAGDLFENATKDQKLATAFHRNHPMTAEGGAIDEEFRLEYVADRTNTTATALMGMTMECAKCHDHKYDPISQKEYYQMSSFFNNVREVGMTGDDGNYGPLLQLADKSTDDKIKQQQRIVEDLGAKIKMAEREFNSSEQSLSAATLPLAKDLAIHLPFDKKTPPNNKNQIYFDGSDRGYSNGDPPLVKGIKGSAVSFEYEYDEVYIKEINELDVHRSVSTSVWINTRKQESGKTQVVIGNAGDKNNFWRGWDFYLEDDNKLSVRLINCIPHNLIHLRSQQQIPLNIWTHIAFSYDGSGDAEGIKLYINGKQVVADVIYNRLYKNIRTISSGANQEIQRPLRISKSYRSFTGDNGIFLGLMDDLYVYNRFLSSAEISALYGNERISEPALIRDHHIQHDPTLRSLRSLRSQALQNLISTQDTIDEIMVMEEMPSPRPSFVLNRGQYDSPGDPVEAATPSQILQFPNDLPKNRLGLAMWLFDSDHPLTARTTVNRYWQMIFGQGIVKTVQDFGNQGALPTHPELLDWLSVWLQENNWDIKALIKLMVMSYTYQQNSTTLPQHLEIDPENALLARAPSFRWPAEHIRDNALAASGILVRHVGGPSVKPYQPEGLWIEKGNFSYKLLRYKEDTGEDLYRRTLYTFIKRTSPPPAMTVFDMPNRDVCTVSRETTQTPLQALVLLNDPQYVEAARMLGERMLRESDGSIAGAIDLGFRLAMTRAAKPEEIDILKKTHAESLRTFQQDAQLPIKFLAVGSKSYNDQIPIAENAAMAIVASTILNMDETYMKR